MDNSPKFRIALALLVALLVWLVLPDKLGRWLGAATSMPAAEKPLEMQLVELDPPPVQRAARISPVQPAVTRAQPLPAQSRPLAVPPRPTSAARAAQLGRHQVHIRPQARAIHCA